MVKSRPLVRPKRLPVLIINGATREGGSTDAVTRSLTAGFRTAGARVRIERLRELRIADCLGCRQCRDERTCYFTDDMNRLRAAFMSAHLIVLASPLYFCAVTRSLAAGFRAAGAQVRPVNLRELRIADCLGCRQCRDERTCYFTDDMNRLRAAFMSAHLIVLASPLYFCAVTGLMKSFLDRLYFFYHEVNRHLVAGKRILILTTLGEKRTRFEMAPLIEFYRRYLRALRLRRIGLLTYPDLMDKDSIRKHPEYLEEAKTYARRLIRRLDRS